MRSKLAIIACGVLVASCGDNAIIPSPDAPLGPPFDAPFDAPAARCLGPSSRTAAVVDDEHGWVLESTFTLESGWPPTVAIDGDTAIVGVIRTAPEVDSGYAAILQYDAGWRLAQVLRPAVPRAWERFGNDVAISGEVVVVGAPSDGSSPPRPGEVFVFERDNGVWTERARLRAGDAADGDTFGTNVAISGNTIVANGLGGTYLFDCTADTWSQTERIPMRGPIAIDGDRLLIGNLFDSGLEARIFDRVDGHWEESEVLGASNPADNRFGASVALSGVTAVVGSPTLSVPAPQGMPRCQPGAAYVFCDAGDTWVEEARLDGDADINCFGKTTAIDGDFVAVGSPLRSFAYARRADGWSLDGAWTYDSPALAGDVDVAVSGRAMVVAWPYVATTPNGVRHTYARLYRATSN